MTNPEAKKELLDFLNRKIFDPILTTPEKDFSTEEEQQRFEEVKKSIEEEKQRFQNLDTAEDVKNHFEENMASEPAQKAYSILKQLGLPRLPQFKSEFYELCDKLGVKKD